jgi:hypothetical protein
VAAVPAAPPTPPQAPRVSPPPPPAAPRGPQAAPPPPPAQQPAALAPASDASPLRLLSEKLLVHRNNLANLRQQASDAGRNVPHYVSAGIDHELRVIRGLKGEIQKIAPPLQMRLKRLPEPGEADGEEKVFRHLPIVLGRSAACDWQLDNTQISQIHAWLVQEGDQVLMEDLGSTNGGAIIRNGSLVHRFQPRGGLEQQQALSMAVEAKDLLYVATSRLTVEEKDREVSGG